MTVLDVHAWDVPAGDCTVPQQESPERLDWWAWRDELWSCEIPIPINEGDER